MRKKEPNASFTVECDIDIHKNGDKSKSDNEKGRISRISKLMALAIHFDALLKNGTVRDYSDIAKLGYVSRARLTQVMNLNLLSPEIQENILFLPEVRKGRDPITERQVRKIGDAQEWSEQLICWKKLMNKAGMNGTL